MSSAFEVVHETDCDLTLFRGAVREDSIRPETTNDHHQGEPASFPYQYSIFSTSFILFLFLVICFINERLCLLCFKRLRSVSVSFGLDRGWVSKL